MYCSTEFANNNTVAVRYQTFECHVSLCTWMCESKSERALINVFSFSHFALCRSVCVCVCWRIIPSILYVSVYREYTPPLLLHCYSACNFYLFIIIIIIVCIVVGFLFAIVIICMRFHCFFQSDPNYIHTTI